MSSLPSFPSGLAPPFKHRREVPGQRACGELISGLEQSVLNDWPIAALSRIQTAHAITHEHLNPESFAPVIADLDSVLFDGRLSNYMIVSWESTTGTPCCLSGKPRAEPPHETSRSGSERLRVHFTIYPLGPKEQTWGGILHEMLHTYLDLMSEWHGLKQPHRPLFGAACTAIVGRLALSELKVHHVDGGSGC